MSKRRLPAGVALLFALSACSESSAEDWPDQEPEFRLLARQLFASPSEIVNRHLGERLRTELRDPELSTHERMQREERLAEHLLRMGDIQESIQLYQSLIERAGDAHQRSGLVYSLGIAFLRQAELANCVALHNADCCIFPLANGGVHSEREPARLALDCFRKVLEQKPKNLKARWLVNICAMALAEYPDGVPADLRIPRQAFESECDIGHFRDVAGELGVDTFNAAGGVCVEDFDADGWLDILTSTWDPEGPLTLYRNRGDGGFEDVSAAARVSDQLGGLDLIAGDYDGDGDADALVLRGGWLTTEGRIRNSLLRNDSGVFRDVTRRAGLAEPARPTQTAAWGDFDGDGDLDLFVGNESKGADHGPEDNPSQLFRNEGGGTFTDVAPQAGTTNDRYCKGVTLGDYDNDGDLDAYLSNLQENRLYRNDGGLAFRDVAVELGVTEPVGRSFPCWFFDYDNDGWLDLFVAAYEGSIADLAAEALGEARAAPHPRLYHNREGSFQDATAAAGLERFFLPMGSNFGDFDNDGWLDMLLGTGDPALDSVMPDVALRNDAGRRFQDVTQSTGLGHLQKGHGVAFADLDQDGDQDIYHELGGFFPVDRFQNALFQNPGHGHHFLQLELSGTKCNRAAIGARIHLTLETPEGRREIHRAVGSVSSFGGSSIQRQEIGLGSATRIATLAVTWPGTREPQVFSAAPVDCLLRIVEGRDALERVELRPVALGSQ